MQIEYFPKSIRAFQAFRTRSSHSQQMIFRVFSELRKCEEQLRLVSNLEDCIPTLIGRETALAWKNDIERRHSLIMLSKEDLDRLISELDIACSELLTANKAVLATDFDVASMGLRSDWESITRSRGPRTKKLR